MKAVHMIYTSNGIIKHYELGDFISDKWWIWAMDNEQYGC